VIARERSTCPACAEGRLEPFLELPSVPVLSTVFYPDRELAAAAPRGDLRLALCRRCALVWNVAFEPERIAYTAEYENSQHFSPAFGSFADQLADRLAATYHLSGCTVVEIGSGKGEFLTKLCERAGCRGVGFDPTFDGEVVEDAERVTILRRYYDVETARGLDPSLVIARHVLEHLADPVGFLTAVKEASPSFSAVYYEVPNAEFVFGENGMWDLIYQHVGYFSAPSLELTVRRAGYEVTDLRTAFDGQFLSVEAIPATRARSTEPDAEAAARVCKQVDGFAERLRTRLDGWRTRLTVGDNGKVTLWGAGAKGVAFLNLCGAGDAIDHVVDLNPRKQGRYVPGTGHLIESPEALRGLNTGLVLTMNPAYAAEIRTALRALGSQADVVQV
jgi:hypothetical protein